jgi:hypothetical protein
MNKFIVFVQSADAPKYDFMSFYQAGYVMEWCSDWRLFDPEKFDLVVCDYDDDPAAALEVSAQARGHACPVVFVSSQDFSANEPVRPDAVFPPGMSESDFIASLDRFLQKVRSA